MPDESELAIARRRTIGCALTVGLQQSKRHMLLQVLYLVSPPRIVSAKDESRRQPMAIDETDLLKGHGYQIIWNCRVPQYTLPVRFTVRSSKLRKKLVPRNTLYVTLISSSSGQTQKKELTADVLYPSLVRTSWRAFIISSDAIDRATSCHVVASSSSE